MRSLTRTECMKLLLTCMDLFQPENCGHYARLSREGIFSMELTAGIPAKFPQDYKQMYELSGKIYGAMGSLGLPEPYLDHPNFEKMKARADLLIFEECAQFLLYWSRLNLRYGQECFYKTWQEGTALRVLRQMVSLLDDYQFPEERPVIRKYACIQPELGDITTANVNVVVNPTDTLFSGSGGVDLLIHKKAGPKLREVCGKLGTLPVGSAVGTQGYGLPAASIVHVSVPKQGQPGAPYLLAACYTSALQKVWDTGITSVAFPAIGSGSSGVPVQEALRIGAQTLWSWVRRNPRKEPMTVKVLFTSEEKLDYFRRELMLCIVRDFRKIADPAELGAELRHSLPYLLEECGGMVTLPPERKCHADLGREAFSELHNRYSDLMLALFSLIGSPDYRATVYNAVQQAAPGKNQDLEGTFLAHLDRMGLEACVCWLVYLQRMDYASGGTRHTHIRSCSNGNVYRVLGRIEWLLRVE